MPTITDTVSAQINERLDQLEANLPAVPARVVRLQRAVAAKTYERTADFWSAVSESTSNFFETTRLSGRVVVGQAKAAGDQVATAARTGARTVAGQARASGTQVAGTTRTAANTVVGQTSAQGRKVAGTATGEAANLLDNAIDTVEDKPGSGRRYEQWTKAELLERARELDIEGRTALNKRQLIAALRKAS